MADETGILRAPEKRPDPKVLQPGELGPRQFYFLRQTPQIFGVLLPGQSNAAVVVRAYVSPERTPILRRSAPARVVIPIVVAGTVQVSGLVHARAQGAPKVSTQARPASLVHTRGIGSPTVVAPPVVPPTEPPPTPTTPEVHTPRNLRYVRRRNRPERN